MWHAWERIVFTVLIVQPVETAWKSSIMWEDYVKIDLKCTA